MPYNPHIEYDTTSAASGISAGLENFANALGRYRDREKNLLKQSKYAQGIFDTSPAVQKALGMSKEQLARLSADDRIAAVSGAIAGLHNQREEAKTQSQSALTEQQLARYAQENLESKELHKQKMETYISPLDIPLKQGGRAVTIGGVPHYIPPQEKTDLTAQSLLDVDGNETDQTYIIVKGKPVMLKKGDSVISFPDPITGRPVEGMAIVNGHPVDLYGEIGKLSRLPQTVDPLKDVPKEAIKYLKAHPETRDSFERRWPGLADKALKSK